MFSLDVLLLVGSCVLLFLARVWWGFASSVARGGWCVFVLLLRWVGEWGGSYLCVVFMAYWSARVREVLVPELLDGWLLCVCGERSRQCVVRSTTCGCCECYCSTVGRRLMIYKRLELFLRCCVVRRVFFHCQFQCRCALRRAGASYMYARHRRSNI